MVTRPKPPWAVEGRAPTAARLGKIYFDTVNQSVYPSAVSDDVFPSGPWTGFYNYQPGDRHRMDLHLTFGNGRISGNGNDDVGRFTICGRYDVTTKECWWTKSYPGSHDVSYRGFREGKGIWGAWDIKVFAHGGFHIWPKQAGERETESVFAAQDERVEAVACQAALTPEIAEFCGKKMKTQPPRDGWVTDSKYTPQAG